MAKRDADGIEMEWSTEAMPIDTRKGWLKGDDSGSIGKGFGFETGITPGLCWDKVERGRET